jgi:N-acetyl-anhydromuramyl-L-alanine amidase AmpD
MSSASAHFVVSDRETIQQVRLRDTAWAAPGANELGIQIEMVGRANQTAEQWADAYSTAMLERVAVLVAALCAELGIPARMVDADGLRRGDLGITTHAAVTRAWRRSTHVDPGPSWPGDAFIAAVEARLVV